MKQGETIAIIGADSKRAAVVVEQLIKSPYRMLILDEALEKGCHPNIDVPETDRQVEKIGCCREASWEADIILLSDEVADLTAILEKIREVATNKLVILISGEGSPSLSAVKSALPLSKLVNVEVQKGIDGAANPNYLIKGNEAGTGNFVSSLLQSIGLPTLEPLDHL